MRSCIAWQLARRRRLQNTVKETARRVESERAHAPDPSTNQGTEGGRFHATARLATAVMSRARDVLKVGEVRSVDASALTAGRDSTPIRAPWNLRLAAMSWSAMTRIVLLSVLALSCRCGDVPPLGGSDKASLHLVPCPSVWSATEDELAVRTLIRVTVAGAAHQVQYIFEPSFEPPWAIAITEGEVVLHTFEGSDRQPSPLPVRRVPIPGVAADFVARAWNYVLDEVRYTDARGEGADRETLAWGRGLDGTTRTFLAGENTLRCGATFSHVPPRAAALERIAGMLRDYALAPPDQRAHRSEAIRWAAADLLREWREEDGVAYVVE